MLKDFLQRILALFGKKPIEEKDISRSREYEQSYENTDKVNFAAVFANALSNKTVNESTVDIVGADDKPNKRSEFINTAIHEVWTQANKITSQAIGKGGKVIVPYISNGKAYFDIIDQSRLFISGIKGNRIYNATILADVQKQNEKLYFRWADYTLKDGVHTIRNRATGESGNSIPLASIEAWTGIDEEISITGVDRLLFGFYKNVTDNRKDRDHYGVPITYGSESIIKQIHSHLNLIEREYKLTRPMLGLDAAMWDNPRYGKTVQDKDTPFIPLENLSKDNANLWELYAPAIRDTAMYNRLVQLYEMLEKSVGTSKGILTEPITKNATATEILQSQYDTFCVVSSLRERWKDVIEDLAYAYDVLAEHYNITPLGSRNSYKIVWDWDMRLTENSSETFTQLSEMQSKGIVSKAELRQWKKGGTLDENQEIIDKITESEPSLSQIVGIE